MLKIIVDELLYDIYPVYRACFNKLMEICSKHSFGLLSLAFVLEFHFYVILNPALWELSESIVLPVSFVSLFRILIDMLLKLEHVFVICNQSLELFAKSLHVEQPKRVFILESEPD